MNANNNAIKDEVADKVTEANIFLETIKKKIIELVTEFGFKLIFAIIVLYIGHRIIKYIDKIVKRVLERSQIEDTVTSFLISLTNILLKVLLYISIANIVGVKDSSFVAILGTAGLTIGLALKDSLSNFGGGILILLLKPFKVGDYIKEDSNGNEGIVEEIDIFYTKLVTRDNKVIVIPNGKLSNDSITNFSKKKIRRVDIVIGVDYSENIKRVKEILNDIVRRHHLILKKPDYLINVGELADNSVNFLVYIWCKREDYFTVKFDLLEEIKNRFDEEEVKIPFPQMDIHMLSNK